MTKRLFADFPSVQNWKVEFFATVQNVTGSSAIIFLKNDQPYGGNCSVDKSVGYAINTYFTISCFNWQDKDGNVVMYEFFG